MSDPALNAWVDQVIADTAAGRIAWRLINPTTYTWDTGPPRLARVVLQRVDRAENVVIGGRAQRKVTSQFLLQAFDLAKSPQLPVVTLNGTEDADANEVVKRLYAQVVTWATRESLEFLNSLLPKPSAS